MTELLGTKRDHRIDARSTANRYIAGSERDRGEERRRGGKGYRVERVDDVEQSLQKTSGRQRTGETQNDAERDQLRPPDHHEPDHIPGTRPERDADTDLTGALTDRVGDHAIDADRRHDQRQRAKHGRRNRGRPGWHDPEPMNLAEWPHVHEDAGVG